MMKLTAKRTFFLTFSLLLSLLLLASGAEAGKKKRKKKNKPKEKAPVAAATEQTSSGLPSPSSAAREADRHLNAYDTAAAATTLDAASAQTDAWAATARGRVLEQQQDYEAAATQLRQAADLDTRSPAPVLFLGDTYTYAGKKGSAGDAYAQAESRARELLSANPDDPEGLYFLGVAQQRQARFSDAGQTLEKARSLRPNDSGVLLQLGTTRFYQGQFQEAFDLLSAAIDGNSGLAYAYYYRGLAAAKLQRKDLLFNDLDRFVKMAPNAPEAAQAKQILAAYG